MANLRVDKITSTETFETTGSVQFDGTGDYLEFAQNTDLSFGTGDYTVECWIYPQAVSGNLEIVLNTGGKNAQTFYLHYDQDQLSVGNQTAFISNQSTTFENSTWYHIVACRFNGILKLFRNGVQVGSNATDTTDWAAGGSIRIGLNSDGAQGVFGNISNLRVIKGTALYTSNFKPPMRELEVVPGTVLLACQSKTDASLEKTGKTITVNGNAVANELTPGLLTPVPKAGGGSAITGSVEFNLNGDGLVLPKSSDFAFGTGDFTIEGWFNVSDTGAIRTIFDSRNSDNQNTGIFIGINTDDNFYTYGFPSSTGVTNYGIPKHGEWHHFAVVRNGSNGYVFLNGIKVSGSINTGSTNYTDQGATIGQPATSFAATLYRYKGFLSNIRVNKGTALYTDNFIPPTRELKKVPGTVLLCCQDPDNPLTEATGKTITGHGDLHQVDSTIDLAAGGTWVDGSTGAGSASESNGQITMQGNGASDRGIISKTVTVEPGITYEMSFNVTDAASNGKTGLDSNDGTSDVLDNPTNICDMVQVSGSVLDGNTGTFRMRGVAKSTECVMYFQEFGAAGTTNFIVDNITLHAVGGGGKGASNFTPQVGDDRQITFEGVTKINSDAYFYLPTGDTESRDKGAGTRGFSMGGTTSARSNTISYINISTTGNAKDFGDLLDTINQQASASSSTRGISAGGFGDIPASNETDTVNYITMASTGDAIDFGNLTLARRLLVGCSSQTRGIFAGGYDAPNKYNRMDYVTISSTGNALDFGDMSADGQTPNGKYSPAGYASPTRGVWHGGYGHPAYRNIIDYVTIASTGNTKDFGDSSIANYYMGGCSNSIRGISGGAYNPSPAHQNLIEYTTIATTGNAQDFGDLSQKRMSTGACASQIRGVFLGGEIGGSKVNNISYVILMTMGNSIDFGDLTEEIAYNTGCSNGHGGLG